MSAIFILISASLAVTLAFLGLFVWAVRSGQYEDTITPGMRVVAEEDKSNGFHNENSNSNLE
jgi:cbb3-type cytochrome oxidase maturation protein